MNFDHDLGLIQSILSLDTSIAPPLGGATNSLTITGTGALVLPTGTTAQQPAVAIGQIRYDSDTNKLRWCNNAAWADLSTGGTVTSVGFTDTSTSPIFTISGSPITTSGNLSIVLQTQTQYKVFASPAGSTGQPTFRALVALDIPALAYLPIGGGSITSGGNITMAGGGTVTGLPTVTVNATDATSKAYVDAVASGLNVHNAVEAASIVAYTVTYNNGTGGVGATLTNAGTQAAFSIDSYSPPVGARVLIKTQADQKQNGIYVVTNVGSGATNWILTRASDYDNSPATEARAGTFVFVSEGTTLLKTGWVETGIGTGTGDDIIFGTDNIIFTQFSGAGTYTASLPLLVTGGNNFTISGLSAYGSANQIIGMNNAAGAAEYKTFNGTANQLAIAHAANSVTYSIANNVILPGTGAMTVVSGATGTQPSVGAGQLRYDTTTNNLRWSNASAWADIGTVTTVSVTTANGVSGSVATPTTTPAITLTLGAITPTTVNGNTITTGTGTLTLAAGKTLTVSNTLTLAGTDSTTMTFPTTSATIARTDAANTFTGIQTMTSPALTTPQIIGISTGTGVATAATANTLVLRDANANTNVNNTINGFATQATATGTTTLTVASKQIQEFTGTLTQIVVMPVVSTLVTGQTFTLINNSTSAVTVNSSGGNLIQTMAANSGAILTCVLVTGTTAASWDARYVQPDAGGSVTTVSVTTANGVSGSVATPTTTPAITLTLGAITPTTVNGLTFTALATGFTVAGGTTSKTLQINNSLNFSGTDATTMTFPSTSATIARTDAANTFTGVQTMTSPALTTPAITGISTGTGVSTSATVSTLVLRDTNANIAANSMVTGFATQATATGTTTLTVASKQIQEFTGSLTQIVLMPVVSTLVAGQQFTIINNSTGAVTVNSSGSNLIQTLPPGSSTILTCILITGTTAASWDSAYDPSVYQLYIENASSPTAPTASAANSVAIGSGATASGINAIAQGDGSNASVWGGKAYANGKFATAGDAQSGLYVLRATTTNTATPTELFLDGAGAAQRLVLPNNSVWTFKILIAARRTDATGGGASYTFEGALRKDATAASLTAIGFPSKVILGETNSSWDVALSADTTNGSLKILVTGEATKTIRWVATVITSEVTN